MMTAVPRTEESFDVTDGWDRDGRPPSIAIVETLAAIEGTDPMDLDVFLNDFVDAESLDRLFLAEKSGDLAVEFRVSDQLVTIRADGSLRVRSIETQGATPSVPARTPDSDLR